MCEKHNLLLAWGIMSLTTYQNTPALLGQQNSILPKPEHANLIAAHAGLQMLKEARQEWEGLVWSHDQQVEALVVAMVRLLISHLSSLIRVTNL